MLMKIIQKNINLSEALVEQKKREEAKEKEAAPRMNST